jgi:hypothetical protein
MIKKTIQHAVIVACFAQSSISLGNEVISLFLKDYEITPYDAYAQEVTHTLSRPGKLAKKTIRNILQQEPLSGIFCYYGGNLTTSDATGHILFPRQHESDEVKLLITTQITPIIMAYNTIDHWELEAGTPAAMYSMQRKTDQETDLTFWDVHKIDPPKNNHIPLEVIILFTKPKYVVVPEGITLTSPTANFVLPPIYLKKGRKPLELSLYVLQLRHFFGDLQKPFKKEPKAYLQHVKH